MLGITDRHRKRKNDSYDRFANDLYEADRARNCLARASFMATEFSSNRVSQAELTQYRPRSIGGVVSRLGTSARDAVKHISLRGNQWLDTLQGENDLDEIQTDNNWAELLVFDSSGRVERAEYVQYWVEDQQALNHEVDDFAGDVDLLFDFIFT